ncbi:hypothetical protein B0H11DRAFT_2261505 [Mycena galericulata]|nr:hypothetical protein B0H11DRAFT_2261505 [Mycena galericulata]
MHRTRGAVPPPAALFDEDVAVEESPPSHVRSQPSPTLDGEYDFASNAELFQDPLPGDANYSYADAAANYLSYPDPNAAADSSVPEIATLPDEPETDFNFTDYTDRSGEKRYIDYDEEEQVGGGWHYGLRHKITPSPHAERVGLRAQKRRQESYQAQAEATEDEGDEGPVSPVPAKRRNEGPVSTAPAKRRTKATNAAAGPSTAAHLPKPAAAAPSATANAAAPSAATPPPQTRRRCTFRRRQRRRPPPQTRRRCTLRRRPPRPKTTALRQRRRRRSPRLCEPHRRCPLPQKRRRRRPQSVSERAGDDPATEGRDLDGAGAAEEAGAVGDTRASAACGRTASPRRPNTHAGFLPAAFSDARANAGAGLYTDPARAGGYASIEMPPPPPNWDASRRRTPLPPNDPQPKMELADDQTPNMDGSDAEEEQSDGEDDAAPTGGRPPRAQREAFDRAFADVRERLTQCATEAGVSYGGTLKAFFQEERAGLRPGRNTWNVYQRYANYDDQNRLRERRRLDPSYTSARPVTSLSNAELSRAYKVFVKAHGTEEKADETLSVFFQMGGTGDDTLQARNRRFKMAAKAYEKMNERNRVDDFFACTVLVGGHTNEDDKLAQVVAFPGMAEAIYDGLATSADEIIGIAKTAASTVLIKEQAQLRRNMKAAPAAVSTPRRGAPPSTAATSRPPTASSSAAPTVPQPNERPGSLTMADTTETAVGPLTTADATETAAVAAAGRLPAQIPALHRGTKTTGPVFACEIRPDRPDTQDVRRVMSMASMEDLGEDVFKNNNGFSWTVMAGLLLEKGIRIIGYPANVRLPSEASPMKGSGSWTRGERRWIRTALAARSTPGEGLRYERVVYQPGDRNFVIFSHDYTLPPPPGNPDSAAVRAFWTTSAEPVHCSAGDNTTWEAVYNFADPATLLRPPPTQSEVKAGKKKVEPTKKRKAPAADEDESEEDEEPELEDETSPPPAKRLRGHTPETRTQVGGGHEPASPSPRRVNVTHARRVQKEFPKTPPRTGRPQAPPQVPPQGFASNGGPGNDDDNDSDDDKPIVRSRPRRRHDTPHAEDAPARRAPRHKHGHPDDNNSDDEYSEASGAESVAEDVPPRQTRARAANQAATRAANQAATKPPAAKPKPATLHFDGVELTTPPSKRPRPNAAAKQPSAGSSRPGTSRPAPSHNPPPGTSRRATGERPHNPPPPAPVASFALPPEFAGMEPAQVEAMILAAAAVLRRAPPGA